VAESQTLAIGWGFCDPRFHRRYTNFPDSTQKPVSCSIPPRGQSDNRAKLAFYIRLKPMKPSPATTLRAACTSLGVINRSDAQWRAIRPPNHAPDRDRALKPPTMPPPSAKTAVGTHNFHGDWMAYLEQGIVLVDPTPPRSAVVASVTTTTTTATVALQAATQPVIVSDAVAQVSQTQPVPVTVGQTVSQQAKDKPRAVAASQDELVPVPVPIPPINGGFRLGSPLVRGGGASL
jgi:hypothetical protein